MVIEYTDTEKRRMMDVDDHYTKLLDDLDAELLTLKEGSPAYNAALVRHEELIDQRMDEFDALYAEFEQARFDALGGDLDAILEDGKQQIELIIEAAYKGKAENDLIVDDAGNWMQRTDKPLIENQDARALIRRGLRLHLDALKDDAERTEEINNYMYSYTSISPYTYTDKDRKRPPQEVDIARQYAQITQLPQLTKYGLMRDRLNRMYLSTLPNLKEIDGQQRLAWAVNQTGKKTVPIIFALSQGGTNMKTTQRIDATDDAIVSIASSCIIAAMQNGLQPPFNITPQEIWRRMNGITDSSISPSGTQLADTIRRIDKMRLTLLYMNVKQEVEAQNKLPDDDRLVDGIVEDYYLPARKIYAKTEKGREALAYGFYDLPFVYVYNQAKGHIVEVDASLLDTSDTTGNEGYTLVFKNYLLLEIARMYYGIARDNNRILFDTMYKWTGTPTPKERADRSEHKTENAYKATLKREAKKDRDKIAAILQSWTNKGWILGCDPAKKGNAFIGVDIKLNPANFQKVQLEDAGQ